MYESHFGLSGSPFQLNPDPAFYFDSRGHHNALAYLKFGAHQGEGFIVVTGEIGAGKTTLVRTLLGGLNPEQVVAAQVVSTQLESGELLQAILMSFGIASVSTSKAQLIGRLEAFLTALAVKGRRALLIIDEAQNLKHEAVEELRMLSNFQIGNYGLLQSFLVGQPELRQLLQSKSMEQLRQRVIASCHLGPLDTHETRAYIEHRLNLVGWVSGNPGFHPDSFDRIHHWTGGVPRKINRLCNRLLLAAFLNSELEISAESVDRTAGELRSEIGELSEIPEASVAASRPAPLDRLTAETPSRHQPHSPPATFAPAPEHVLGQVANPMLRDSRDNVRPLAKAASGAALAEHPLPAAPPMRAAETHHALRPEVAQSPVQAQSHRAEQRRPLTVVPTLKEDAHRDPQDRAQANQATSTSVVSPQVPEKRPGATLRRQVHRASEALNRPLICLVDTAAQFLQSGTLAEVFRKFPALPPVLALHAGPQAVVEFGEMADGSLPLPWLGMHLEGLADSFGLQTRQVLELFEDVLGEFAPSGLLVMGSSDATLACALLARKHGVPIYRISGGMRPEGNAAGRDSNGALIDRISNAIYIDRMDSYYTLYQEGINSDNVLCVGNLAADMLKFVMPHAPGAAEVMAAAGPNAVKFDPDKGFALLQLDIEPNKLDNKLPESLVKLLCGLGMEQAMIWPAEPATIGRLEAGGDNARLHKAGVTAMADQGYLQQLGLLQKARCLVAVGACGLIEEARALRLPILHIHPLPGSSDFLAKSESAGTTETAPDAPTAFRSLLKREMPALDVPEYWDSDVATRIAINLGSMLSPSESGEGKRTP